MKIFSNIFAINLKPTLTRIITSRSKTILTQNQLEEYDKNGFIVVENLVSDQNL